MHMIKEAWVAKVPAWNSWSLYAVSIISHKELSVETYMGWHSYRLLSSLSINIFLFEHLFGDLEGDEDNPGFSTTDTDDVALNMDPEWNYGMPDQLDDESEDNSDENNDEMM
jgi:hypothetical protein